MFRTKLLVYQDFIAAHSLDTRQEPHNHLWKTVCTFTGEPVRGRIIDLPTLERAVVNQILPLENTYLNENNELPEMTRGFPTCETLGAAIFERIKHSVIKDLSVLNPTLKILSVQVTLCDRGQIIGSAIFEQD